MIKKIELKIFLIIFVLLSIIITVVIAYNGYNSYNSTIRGISMYIERIFDDKRNPERENIEGLYAVKIVGRRVAEDNNVPDIIKEYAQKILKDNLMSGIIGDYIYTNRIRGGMDKKAGTIILFESKDSISDINQGVAWTIAIYGVCMVIVFITSKKIAKAIVKPIKETFDKQTEFISDASHELKTPLAVIRANVDVIEKESGKTKWITYVQNEVDSMSNLINELLLLSKIDSVGKSKDIEQINVSEELELISSAFESMAYEKKIKYETDIKEDILFNIDKEDLKHISSTLIDNAIKHTESNNSVKVNLSKEKDGFKLEVKNQGEEILKSERERIFERFYRVDKARNREEKRYGLGLSICKATVEKYKGTIDVDYKDGYTVFRVKI